MGKVCSGHPPQATVHSPCLMWCAVNQNQALNAFRRRSVHALFDTGCTQEPPWVFCAVLDLHLDVRFSIYN